MTESLRRIWEQSLVLRAQTGDDRAFGELVEVFHKPLQSHVQRLLGTREAADDILQETWADHREVTSPTTSSRQPDGPMYSERHT